MKQSIVDIPKHTERSKYNLEQLVDLPVGKALMTELTSKNNVRTVRGCIWNYCRRHELNCRTITVRKNGHHILYTWKI